ncbi:MAG TPA: 4-hydroxythreonine-4-phosphate dehydrogenase PdxA, partial [Gemmatimonadaceae bacterium]|nr:4-hydroxythreonine-4-phosphate dehydrogenase PdxA [Gemmatimonadaceae bacterium]
MSAHAGSSREPAIAVTLGDVRGIGPEIIEKALAGNTVRASARFLLVGPTGTSLDVDEPVGEWHVGESGATAGRLAGRAIERAVELALRGDVQGIVTAPLDKAALHAGGYDYPGHTEMLAALTDSHVAMMLAATRPNESMPNPLRVVLATTHLALRDVPRALTTDLVVEIAQTTRDGLRDW